MANPDSDDPLNESPTLQFQFEEDSPTPSVSQENAKMEYAFTFKVSPARNLKQALEVLCETELNQEGFGDIYVDGDGFGVMVGRHVQGPKAHLFLRASELVNFQFRNYISETLSLTEVYKGLSQVADEGTITLYQIDGCQKLFFAYESTGFSVGFSNSNLQPSKPPQYSSCLTYCKAALPSEDLKQMSIDWSRAGKPPVVSIEIRNEEAFFRLEDKDSWSETTCLNFQPNYPTNYRAWIKWGALAKSLEMASSLASKLEVCFRKYPSI